MTIVQASVALSSSVHAVIALQMARALLARRVDPTSDVAVIHALAQEGFGIKSVIALRKVAARAVLKVRAH